MSERDESNSEKDSTRYVAFGVCLGLLIGTALGVITGGLTGSIVLVLPILSSFGLVAGTIVGLYLANKSNV